MSAKTRAKTNSAAEKAVPVGRVSWTSPNVVKVLERVNDGSSSVEAAAGKLGTKSHYVGVRAGWLKSHGTAAEPAERGGKGKQKSTKRAAGKKR